jgi:hypothetical protein
MQWVEEFLIDNWSAPSTRSDEMRLTIFAAMFAFLLWGAPAFAGSNPDFDGDGVGDVLDNCSEKINAAQDDTDDDFCGNYCDADYNQTGGTNVFDLNMFRGAYLGHDELFCHVGTIPGCTVNVFDLNFFRGVYLTVPPGPSGSTPGTVACP